MPFYSDLNRGLPFRKKHKKDAALARLRQMRRPGRVMHKRARRVVAQPVVEDARDDVNLLRPGVVDVKLQEPRARVDLQQLCPRPIGPLPEDALTDPWIDFEPGNFLAVYVDDFA